MSKADHNLTKLGLVLPFDVKVEREKMLKIPKIEPKSRSNVDHIDIIFIKQPKTGIFSLGFL